MTARHQHITKKTAAVLLSVAATGLVGGAASSFIPHRAAAETATAWQNSKSQKEDGQRTAADPALVIEAFESYMARPHALGSAAQPGMDATAVDQLQVEKLKISGKNAFGRVNNGDNGFIFFAHKTDDVWSVIFAGNDIPDPATVDKYKIPKAWLRTDS